MIQDLTIQKLTISKQGERHYFQINIPRQAEKIVGVEMGAFFTTPVLFADGAVQPDTWLSIKRNRSLGALQLQTSGHPNFFYSGELVQEDANIGSNDYRKTNGLPAPPVGSYFWKSQQYTHGGKQQLDEILINDERTVYGCFTDSIGETLNTNISYTVLVYLWFQCRD